MSPAEVFAAFAVSADEADGLMARLRPDTPQDWRALAAAMALGLSPERCRVLGLAGGQGAGKSTLSMLLEQAYRLRGVKLLVLSLDDFYLTRGERQVLARREHPLLATRGVPGSHDVERLSDTLAAVFRPGPHRLPVFDKGADDRAPEPHWFEGPADMVVIEGWCVGAHAQPDARLSEPVNSLERQEDAEGRWRGYVNDCLNTSYASLWRQIDKLLFLAVPDIDAVIHWRSQQELARPKTQRMTAAQIRRFVCHYQRLTEWMLERLPAEADFVGFLDANHRLESIQRQY
jgi:D-glycerate 3-kinase